MRRAILVCALASSACSPSECIYPTSQLVSGEGALSDQGTQSAASNFDWESPPPRNGETYSFGFSFGDYQWLSCTSGHALDVGVAIPLSALSCKIDTTVVTQGTLTPLDVPDARGTGMLRLQLDVPPTSTSDGTLSATALVGEATFDTAPCQSGGGSWPYL